ncbi:MAG: phosphatidate cytidylyltransferase [Bacteroidales bacterium]|nr:phosphatidate cytidylyltransferase [Bacteroidales bacterium]
MNNLLKRAITGAIYVLSVIAAIFIHPIITAVYFLIIAIIGLWEFYNIAGKKNIMANKITAMGLCLFTYACVLLISECEFQSAKVVTCFAILDILLIFINELYRKSENPFTNIAYTLMGIIYVVVPLALTNMIIKTDGKFSPMILMSVFIFAWCNDTFAYLTGMKFGKHKLFERISPKKTWEGWVGGFLFTIIAAIIVSHFSDALSVIDFIVIAVITSVIGTFGDLVESMFKRQVGVKDSGNILPGHGGILDRFDILLLVLPAVWLYLNLFC